MQILNLTQHTATAEQAAAGVYDLPTEPTNWAEDSREYLANWLTFPHPSPRISEEESTPPSRLDVQTHATILAEIAARTGTPENPNHPPDAVMIGGAPFLMSALEAALMDYGLQPVYAFSLRESVDEPQPDGGVVKKSTFRHIGFIPGD